MSSVRSSLISKNQKSQIQRGGTKHLSQIGSKLTNESYAVQFPGALPLKQIIRVKDIDSLVWKLATVVHCRAIVENPKCPKDYEYYIHINATDRRLDKWMEYSEFKLLNDALPKNSKIDEAEDLRSIDEEHAETDEDHGPHGDTIKVKTISNMVMGKYIVNTWYFSPYPKEFQMMSTIYICEFCLSFYKHNSELLRHRQCCNTRHPPGDEIFKDIDQKLSVWEVDGRLSRVYCENLCYLSKLFLEHKTLKHPVHLFLFYILTEIDDIGYHVVGYFSKEKYSKNNVSCILTLPQYQRKGYGKFLISFSYVLSHKERKKGTPERPLSDLGKASYIAFWLEKILDALKECKEVSIDKLSELTGIETKDVILCLDHFGLVKWISSNQYPMLFLSKNVESLLYSVSGRATRDIDLALLHWQSYDNFIAAFEYNPN